MKLLKEFARYFVGGLFMFSGMIKVNDPAGTAIKLEEYFEVFAYDFAPFFEWFIPTAMFLSVFLSVFEVVLGVMLLIGYRTKLTAWALTIMIVFFTFLTFYSAYFNKVTDCGCFGDAIKLTPWESFTKDIILCVFIALIFVFKDNYKPWLSEKVGMITTGATTLILVVIAITAIRHLPFIDFRSYAVGNNIGELMQPSGELIYEYVMIKDGKEERMSTYPSDPSYEFKEMVVLNPEVQPKITDLAVWNDNGEFTDQLLQGNRLLIITHSIAKTSDAHNEEINALISSVKNAEVWALTSSSAEEFEAFRDDAKWQIPYFFTDATVLKTIVRSTPGIVLLQDGVVMGKWHHNDTPSASEIHRLL